MKLSMNLRNKLFAVCIGFGLGLSPTLALADSCRPDCGKVESVTQQTREGKATAKGLVGGAVIGGLLGNQIGKGQGNTLATVAGAAGGAYAGREVEKKATERKVHVVSVKMDNGSKRSFEFENEPPVLAGDRVQVVNNQLKRYAGK